jgi:hypothetical protein
MRPHHHPRKPRPILILVVYENGDASVALDVPDAGEHSSRLGFAIDRRHDLVVVTTKTIGTECPLLSGARVVRTARRSRSSNARTGSGRSTSAPARPEGISGCIRFGGSSGHSDDRPFRLDGVQDPFPRGLDLRATEFGDCGTSGMDRVIADWSERFEVNLRVGTLASMTHRPSE